MTINKNLKQYKEVNSCCYRISDGLIAFLGLLPVLIALLSIVFFRTENSEIPFETIIIYSFGAIIILFLFTINFKKFFCNFKTYFELKKDLKLKTKDFKKTEKELYELISKLSDKDLNDIFKCPSINKEDFNDIFNDTINKRINKKISEKNSYINDVYILNRITEDTSLIENL